MIIVNIGTNKPGAQKFFGQFSEKELAEKCRNRDKIFSNFSTAPGPKSYFDLDSPSGSLWNFWMNRIAIQDHSPRFFWLVAYSEKGKLLSPEMLCGILSPFWAELNEESRRRWLEKMSYFNGRRRKAWGHWRRPRTTQERRFVEETVFLDVDEETEELNVIPIKFRARKNLPNSWDDIYAHAQKSWKKQSKRPRQFK